MVSNVAGTYVDDTVSDLDPTRFCQVFVGQKTLIFILSSSLGVERLILEII